MSKWKWLAGFGYFSVSIAACAMHKAEAPNPPPTPAAGEPVARVVRPSPDVATLEAETIRDQFDARLTAQLSAIDARIKTDTQLYEEVSAADKERMSGRWQIALSKRAAID